MKSIKNKIEYKYIIEKSEFITVINKINSVDEIESIMNDIKKEYKEATHYCYAYIVDDKRKSSDDNEPGGTAGVPMMETLNQYDLNYVFAVVVRYFGGIKLGAGGLTRAYRKAINDALVNNKDSIVDLIDGYRVKLKTTYDKQKDIEYKYKRIIKKTYNENVLYDIDLTVDEYNDIKDKYEILEENKIKIEI